MDFTSLVTNHSEDVDDGNETESCSDSIEGAEELPFDTLPNPNYPVLFPCASPTELQMDSPEAVMASALFGIHIQSGG